MQSLADPTVDVAEHFRGEAILAIARRREFHIHLDAAGERVVTDDSIPVWMANAITIYGGDLIALMRAEFLGDWRRCSTVEDATGAV